MHSQKYNVLRRGLFSILRRVSNEHNVDRVKGLYPPTINLCQKQDDHELLKQLSKIIEYLERPEYSHLTRKYDTNIIYPVKHKKIN